MNDILTVSQKKLSDEQLKPFYKDIYAPELAQSFIELLGRNQINPDGVVVDIGGGRGFFAQRINEMTGWRVRVVDSDVGSIKFCEENHGKVIESAIGDAIQPEVKGDESIICFSLILHHLISNSEIGTAALQKNALSIWRGDADYIFVNEYIYDSYIWDLSGAIIFAVTKSRLLSVIAKQISRFLPSLKANTFGVGVRFRSDSEWRSVFSSCGFSVIDYIKGREEAVSFPRRLLLIRSIRRDFYLLKPT